MRTSDYSAVKFNNFQLHLPVALATVGARAIEVPLNLILAASGGDFTRLVKLHAQLVLRRLVVRLFVITSEKRVKKV